MAFEHRRDSYGAEDRITWLRQLIGKCVDEGILRPIFTIDNAPVRSNLESILTTEIVRVVPDSYKLSPIELQWI